MYVSSDEAETASFTDTELTRRDYSMSATDTHKPGHCESCGRKLGSGMFFGAMASPGTSLCLDCF
jgi:hypothetical protein